MLGQVRRVGSPAQERAEAISYSCVTYETGQKIVLTDTYTEAQLLRAYDDRKYVGSPWWPDLESCVRTLRTDFSAVIRERRSDRITVGAITTFMPPIIALLLGITVRWIYRGFRKPPRI